MIAFITRWVCNKKLVRIQAEVRHIAREVSQLRTNLKKELLEKVEKNNQAVRIFVEGLKAQAQNDMLMFLEIREVCTQMAEKFKRLFNVAMDVIETRWPLQITYAKMDVLYKSIELVTEEIKLAKNQLQLYQSLSDFDLRKEYIFYLSPGMREIIGQNPAKTLENIWKEIDLKGGSSDCAEIAFIKSLRRLIGRIEGMNEIINAIRKLKQYIFELQQKKRSFRGDIEKMKELKIKQQAEVDEVELQLRSAWDIYSEEFHLLYPKREQFTAINEKINELNEEIRNSETEFSNAKHELSSHKELRHRYRKERKLTQLVPIESSIVVAKYKIQQLGLKRDALKTIHRLRRQELLSEKTRLNLMQNGLKPYQPRELLYLFKQATGKLEIDNERISYPRLPRLPINK